MAQNCLSSRVSGRLTRRHRPDRRRPRRGRCCAPGSSGARPPSSPPHDQDAACEFLGQHGVARVARSRRLHPLPQFRAFVDQRIDPLARVAFRQFHRWLDRQHRPRRLMDRKADPVVASFRCANLRGLHEHDPLRWIAGRQPVHNFAHVGRTRRAIPPGFGRCATRQHAVPIRPFRHGQPIRIF